LPGIDLTIDGIFRLVYGFACWLWSIAIVLLVIFIVISGLRFMYAGADPKKFTDAKTNFKYVILGAIVVMGTFVIISTVAYNIGVDISFVPFDCAGNNDASSGGGLTPAYQGDGFQCYATATDCRASGDSRCVECPDSECTDGVDCNSSGNSGSHLECINNACTFVDGGGHNGPGCASKAEGDSCGINSTPVPTLPPAHMECVNNSCTFVNGAGPNLDGCNTRNQACTRH